MEYCNHFKLNSNKLQMTTIIGLLIVFLAILFTISLILGCINHFIQLRNIPLHYHNSFNQKRNKRNLLIRMIMVSVLYTLLFYWYF